VDLKKKKARKKTNEWRRCAPCRHKSYKGKIPAKILINMREAISGIFIHECFFIILITDRSCEGALFGGQYKQAGIGYFFCGAS
jgi:hypothetical protein